MGLKTTLVELDFDDAGIALCVREGYTPDRVGHNLRALGAPALERIRE